MEGSLVYIPHETEAWIPATVMKVSEDGNIFTVIIETEGEQNKSKNVLEIDLSKENMTGKLPFQNPNDSSNGIEDMCQLSYLHEPAILFNLKMRFFRALPYTYTGDICIAVNPYQRLDLYSSALRMMYLDLARSELPPHVYATSSAAYRHMIKKNTAQSILVSGESGAGKTETVKIMMEHLATIAGESKYGHVNIIDKVLKSSPLLESFGNAKTVRNDNSSRFGKFTQLQFDKEHHLVGTNCRHYLLEKSRVVNQAEGERNYHIFYQILCSNDSNLYLENCRAKDFRYTRVSSDETPVEIDGMSDKERFSLTCDALKTIDIHEEEQFKLFRVLSGILYLGQIEFSKGSDDDSSQPLETQELDRAADLLGCSVSELSSALCSRTVKARNEAYSVPLKVDQAINNKEALAKELYSRLFGWLVARINASIGCDHKMHNHIDLLDIFGFECFKTNSFEQFCINFANEKLQQRFTLDVLKNVQIEYMEEGVPWDPISFQDNTDMLDLIEGKMGLIALLNEECVRPKGSDLAFASKLTLTHEDNKYLEKARLNQTQFMLKHYAGPVVYDSDGFVEKNRDTLQIDMSEYFTNTKNLFLKSLFVSSSSPNNRRKSISSSSNSTSTSTSSSTSISTSSSNFTSFSTSSSTSSSNTCQRKGSKMVNETVSSKFKIQLSALMVDISATEVHYIRCIKPNNIKSSSRFDQNSVVEQLRCAGVIEAIKVTRAAFPNKLKHEEFLQKYIILKSKSELSSSNISSNTYSLNTSSNACSIACESLAKSLFSQNLENNYFFGKTKIYFRSGALEELEEKRIGILNTFAIIIQKIFRRFLQETYYKRIRKSIIRIQSEYRKYICFSSFRKLRNSIILIQSLWRGKLGRVETQDRVDAKAACKLQALFSMILARKRFLQYKKAAIHIQSIIKMHQQIPLYKKLLEERKEQVKMESQLSILKQRLDEECFARKQIEAKNTSLQQQLAAANLSSRRSSEFKNNKEENNKMNKNEDEEEGEGEKKLLNESGKMLEYMRGEMNKLREQNERLRLDNENLKAENKRVKEAYTAAGSSFAALNQHNKQQSKANLRLMSTHAALIKSQEEKMKKYQKQATDLKEELRMQRNVYSAELMQRVQQQEIIMNMLRLAESYDVEPKVIEGMRALIIDTPPTAIPPPTIVSPTSSYRSSSSFKTDRQSYKTTERQSYKTDRKSERFNYGGRESLRYSIRQNSKDIQDLISPSTKIQKEPRDSFVHRPSMIFDDDRRKSKIGGMLKKMFTGKDV